MHTLLPCPDDAEVQLAHAVRELARTVEDLRLATSQAYTLAEQTDWKARAAVEFHVKATHWADDLARLIAAVEDARWCAARSRDRAVEAAALRNGCA